MTARLAFDAALPMRDALLDPGLVGRRLGAAGGHATCERLRATYRVGRSLRVCYRLDGRVVAGRTFPGRSAEVFARASSSAEAGAVVHLDDLEAVFWHFPNDRKLRSLELVADARAVSQLTGMPVARVTLVGYAPEKAAVARCLDASGETLAFVKVYADDGGARTQRLHRALERVWPRPPVSRTLLYAADRAALVLHPVPGERLDGLHGVRLERGAFLAGEALACLHAVCPTGLPSSVAGSARVVAEAADLVGRARPELAPEAAALAGRLGQTRPERADPVLLHGDVHLKNLILGPSAVTLIDLDQAAAGPAAADLGSVLAALRYASLVGELSTYDAGRVATALRTGYALHAQLPDAGTLGWYTAAALLSERALRAVSRVREQGLARLPDVLCDASCALREGGLA